MRILLLTVIVLLIQNSSALACSCVREAWSPEGSRDNIDRSAFIFEGKVLSVSHPAHYSEEYKFDEEHLSLGESPYLSKAKVQIETLYKGQNARETLTIYADTVTSCGTTDKYLLEQTFFILNQIEDKYVLSGHCGSFITEDDMKALKEGQFLTSETPPPP